MTSLINVCQPWIEEKRHPACGDYLVDLTSEQGVQTININQLPKNASCSYRIHTTCGYPASVYSSDIDIG